MGCPRLVRADQRLGLYWPLAGEPDLRELAWVLPDRLALPAIRPTAGERRLRYEIWQPGDPLQPDAAGVLAPALAGTPLPATALGLLLVPALAFDRRGFRLGYGGGWFDRLRADPCWRSVPALIVAPACLRRGAVAEGSVGRSLRRLAQRRGDRMVATC